MLHQASDIATSTSDPFDGGCPADTQNIVMLDKVSGGLATPADVSALVLGNPEADALRAQLFEAITENKRLVLKNQHLLKAITDISNELDDLVTRVGLVASRATAN